MTDTQQREAARQFYYKWNGKGKEDEDARSYWIDILQNILGIDNVTDRVQFEKKLTGADGNKKRIDIYIPETHVLIEQKSLGIALDKPQAGHDGMTPYEQAKYYDNYLPFDERARWIVTSNFSEIWIYDRNADKPEPIKIGIADLQSKYHMLDFLVNKKTKEITEEVELSKAAGELVGKIRDRFLTQYNDPLAKRTQKSLNVLCVRLVFCFYAEDAGLFGARDAFSSYLMQYQPKDMRGALIELFKTLDTPLDERADLYLSDELAAFPYVNGGLFSDENIVIPKITQEIKDSLEESGRFDWSRISPTIFGAVFESTLNPETRRAGGMHYTSIENIHKVIDPLFLDELKEELHELRKITVPNMQKKKLDIFQDKLASLVFLDPACGSGNFLTETFLSLRRLENEVLRMKVAADQKITTGQISFGFDEASPIRVSIHQLYGIEINDFAVAVAQTALWIAESQMFRETEEIVHSHMDFFPLKEYKGIVEGNALRIDWESVVSKEKLNYIMGNPPFVGYDFMNPEQKKDMQTYFGQKTGRLDYVTAWYIKASKLIKRTKIRCAFVSTNSVTQGVQVPDLWKPVIKENGSHIDFAYRTFIWDSEANLKAHVHCVIIGFSYIHDTEERIIFDESGNGTVVKIISPYLIESDEIIVKKRSNALYDVPNLILGNMPKDGGGFVLTEDEREEFIKKEPLSEKWIKPYIGAVEFINKRKRYCLWLVDASPAEIKKCPMVAERVKRVREFRLASKALSTQKFGETPTLFCQISQPDKNFIIVPKTSSGRRRYVPLGFANKDIITSDLVFIIPGATLYEFGVLSSNVHNAWLRVIGGRLKSDYRYSRDIVYNTFPWPKVDEELQRNIVNTAQRIIDARKIYPDSSLADLYDPTLMPQELRKAHQLNDAAVMKAYGMPIKETDEAKCVAWLMRLYQEKVAELDKK